MRVLHMKLSKLVLSTSVTLTYLYLRLQRGRESTVTTQICSQRILLEIKVSMYFIDYLIINHEFISVQVLFKAWREEVPPSLL